MINGKLSILSTNVTGIKISEKRLKIFEYFRNLSAPAGFVFLQEPHSLVDVKKKKKKKKKTGTIFKDNSSFHLEKQILVEFP